MSRDFFQSIAAKTQQSPSRGTDQRILNHAASVLMRPARPWGKWALATSVPIAAALVVWLQVSSPVLPPAMLAESPEMLQHLDEIELLSELSDLSDEELRYLETGES
jgi:hypothetical protein